MNSARNARGSDDDRRQIIADLISNDDSPFTPDDLDALGMMTEDSLRATRDAYLKPAKAKTQRRANCLDGIDKRELATLVENAIAEALAEHGLGTNTPKSDARRSVVEKRARSLLRGLGIANPTDEQVRATVDTLLAQLDDGDNGAEPGTIGDADAKAMSMANTAEELAREAEARGDARHANVLRTLATVRTDNEQRQARSAAYAANAAAILRANRTASDDPAVKAMSEFNGPEAFQRALNAKREREGL